MSGGMSYGIYSNVPDSGLSMESIQRVIAEIRAWSDSPAIPNQHYPLPPVSLEMHTEIQLLSDLLGEDYMVIHQLILQGIYRKTPWYCCNIAAYREHQEFLRITYGIEE